MRTDEEARNVFIDGMLREALRVDMSEDEGFVGKVLAAKDGFVAAGERAGWKVESRTGLAFAAASLAVCGILFFWLLLSGTVAVASVREVRGEAEIERGNGTRDPAVAGSSIYPGDRIICGGEGAVLTTTRNGDSWSVEGTVSFEKNANAVFESGRALCTVAAGRKRLSFRTPHFEGDTDDAVFEMLVGEESTEVRALAGQLRVWRSGEAEEWTPVAAGYMAESGGGASLIAESFDHTDAKPGDAVWVQEFDTHFREEGSIEGKLAVLREGEALVTAIRSIPVLPYYQEEDFKPDEWISLELMSRHTLFVTPEDLEMELRVRSEKEGSIRVAMSPADPEIKAEHSICAPVKIGPEWKTIVIPAARFLPWEGSRQVKAGLPVRSIAVWAWDTGTVSVDQIKIRRAKEGKIPE